MKMKFEVELDVPEAFFVRRQTPASLFLVDKDGNALEEPTEEQIKVAERKAAEKTKANIRQMLFAVPIANQFRHDGIEPGPDFKVEAREL